jgi:hypothetical protein
MPKVPDAMLTRNRRSDQNFADDEVLYRRFHSENYLHQNRRVTLDAIALPDMSVNRSKYGGKPEYLLLGPNAQWGVFEFEVKDIPSPAFDEAGNKFEFSPFHAPMVANYFHTEIRCYDANAQHVQTENAIPKEVQLRWRRRLHCKIKVTKVPITIE